MCYIYIYITEIRIYMSCILLQANVVFCVYVFARAYVCIYAYVYIYIHIYIYIYI